MIAAHSWNSGSRRAGSTELHEKDTGHGKESEGEIGIEDEGQHHCCL